eukprot:3409645-Rhodomonas_salina.1
MWRNVAEAEGGGVCLDGAYLTSCLVSSVAAVGLGLWVVVETVHLRVGDEHALSRHSLAHLSDEFELPFVSHLTAPIAQEHCRLSLRARCALPVGIKSRRRGRTQRAPARSQGTTRVESIASVSNQNRPRGRVRQDGKKNTI